MEKSLIGAQSESTITRCPKKGGREGVQSVSQQRSQGELLQQQPWPRPVPGEQECRSDYDCWLGRVVAFQWTRLTLFVHSGHPNDPLAFAKPQASPRCFHIAVTDHSLSANSSAHCFKHVGQLGASKPLSPTSEFFNTPGRCLIQSAESPLSWFRICKDP